MPASRGRATRAIHDRPSPRLLVALLAALLAVTASACGSASAGGEADALRKNGSVDLSKVSLSVGDQKGGARVLLKASGQLDDMPYQVHWREFTSGTPLVEAVHAGELDLGSVGNTPPIFGAAAGADFTTVYASDTPGKYNVIVVPKSSPIDSVRDLEGKTVAVTEGSSANYHLLVQLRRVGLTLDDVKMRDLEPPDALAAFTTGSVDAWAIWDPYAAQAQVQYGAKEIANGQRLTNGYWFQIASNASMQSKATRVAIQDFLQRLTTAELWSNRHPEQWAQAWAKDTGIPVAATRLAVERRHLVPIPIDDSVLASEQRIADAFAKAGVLPGPVHDLSQWFSGEYSGMARSAAPAR
jgi:sulfonate transport system substrate-binding protein